jgi:hypothetical protein
MSTPKPMPSNTITQVVSQVNKLTGMFERITKLQTSMASLASDHEWDAMSNDLEQIKTMLSAASASIQAVETGIRPYLGVAASDPDDCEIDVKGLLQRATDA